MAAGFPAGCATPVSLARSAPFPVPATSNRACGSPAHGSPTPFTAGIRLLPPGLPRPGRDSDSIQADQAEFARRGSEHHLPSVVAAAAVLLADEQREPHPRVLPDRAEAAGRVTVPEVPGPAAQEHVHVLRDRLRRQQQPAAAGQFPDPVAGVLHRLVRGPSGKERHPRFPVQPPRAHQPVVEAEEIKALASLLQVHDAGLGRLRLQAEPGQQDCQPLQRGLGLTAGPAHHDQVIGIAGQHPVALVPRPVQPVQVEVAHDGTGHAPNAKGNFCFEATLGYRRVERGR